VYDKGGGELHPHTNYFVARNTKFYGSALFRLRKEDLGEIRHHGGVSPAWPISFMTRWSPITRRLKTFITCTAIAVKTRPNRGPVLPIAIHAVSHEPRIQHLAKISSAPGHEAFFTFRLGS